MRVTAGTTWQAGIATAVSGDDEAKTDATGNGPASAPYFAGSAVDNRVESGTLSVFDAVDKFLNLGASDRLSSFESLSDAEKEQFAKVLGKLLQNGVVGYEVLEIDGEPRKMFIDLEIGDEKTYGARRVEETYSVI